MTVPCSCRSFYKNCTGLAAVEFALFLPLLMILFLGGYEMSRYLLMHQKADRIAYTVTDVATQSKTLTLSQLNRILTVSSEIMNPYQFQSSGVVVVSSVYQPEDALLPTIRWQHSGGGGLDRTSRVGTSLGDAQLPGGLTLNGKDNIVISEVFFRYVPMFSLGIFTAQDIYKSVIFKPRLGALTTPPM